MIWLQNAEHVVVGELLVVIADRGRAVEHHRDEILAKCFPQFFDQLIELVLPCDSCRFYRQDLPVAGRPAAARISTAETTEIRRRNRRNR